MAGAVLATAFLLSPSFLGGVAAAGPVSPPYSFSQTINIDIRASQPKNTNYYAVIGDTVTKGQHNVWYGG